MKKSITVTLIVLAGLFLVIGYVWGQVDAASFSIGDTVEVTTDLNVCTGAGTGYCEITDSDYPGYAPTGTTGKILSGPSSADGYIWWEVDFGPGLYSGWSTEDGFKQAEKITINNWIIEVTAYRSSESVDVYLNPKDSKESWSVIEVPKSPYLEGLSSIVLIARRVGEEKVINFYVSDDNPNALQVFADAFIAAELSSPENHLVILNVQIHNKDKMSKVFSVGDINIIGNDGQKLPYVAVARGKSYLVAKPSVDSWKTSQKITISVGSDEKLMMTYCFIIPLKSFPVSLQFQKTKTNFVMKEDKLPEYKKDSLSSWMEIAAKTRWNGLPFPGDPQVKGFLASLKGSLGSQEGDFQFSPVMLPKGSYSTNVGSGILRTVKTQKISEKLNGKELTRSLSSLYFFEGGHYLAGTITIMKKISPFEAFTSYSKSGLSAIFKSSFQATKGDVLAAVGLGDVLSFRTVK